MKRCDWVSDDPLYIAYHDEEWGVPVRDDQALFAKLTLDGFQAGLSWLTVLRKRDNFRAAFDGFDLHTVAAYDEAKINSLLQNAGIIRHEGKIRATIGNAQAVLKMQAEGTRFSDFLWSFVGHKTIMNQWRTMQDVPTQTVASQAMSKALKQRGFRFVGPTICYAFMQAVGMVHDHTTDCFRYGLGV
jgi:DNA-3-methyladenine glycosylase I